MLRKEIIMIVLATVVARATPQEDIATQVPAARAILDAWQGKDPIKAERKLHIVLWTPSDRDPAPRYSERLDAVLKDIQKFYAGEMERLGFGPRTLRFDEGVEGKIKIHLVKGEQPYASYGRNSGNDIRKECLGRLTQEGIDADKETIVIFCNMSNWDPAARKMTQNSPYYAGGTHMKGTAWQVDSPLLDLSLLTEKGERFHDGEYGDISVGRYNSIFIGGIAHELGHALGLPHNCARADEAEAFGTALMGSGNRTYKENLRGEGKGSFITLAHGLRLASHPIFCGSVKGVDIPANVKTTDLTITSSGKGFDFSGKVTANPPVYAVLAYMDPSGGGDYDGTTTSAIPDKEGNFILHCQAFKSGKTGELRIVYLQSNGVASGFLSSTPFRYPYEVAEDGKVDFSTARAMLVTAPLSEAIAKNDGASIEATLEAISGLNDPSLMAIASRYAKSNKPVPVAEVAPEIFSIPLTCLKALSEKTGYGPPVRDRLPEGQGIFVSGGKVFPGGFYAHAPAEHIWELGGKWKTLSGHAGLADGKDGSVKFTIIGDGKTLWESGVMKVGETSAFQIDLSGVDRLILTTGDGGDGRGNDWGLWLDPILGR